MFSEVCGAACHALSHTRVQFFHIQTRIRHTLPGAVDALNPDNQRNPEARRVLRSLRLCSAPRDRLQPAEHAGKRVSGRCCVITVCASCGYSGGYKTSTKNLRPVVSRWIHDRISKEFHLSSFLDIDASLKGNTAAQKCINGNLNCVAAVCSKHCYSFYTWKALPLSILVEQPQGQWILFNPLPTLYKSQDLRLHLSWLSCW